MYKIVRDDLAGLLRPLIKYICMKTKQMFTRSEKWDEYNKALEDAKNAKTAAEVTKCMDRVDELEKYFQT